MFFILLFLIVIFLCWGSFLNVVAYRSINDKPMFQKRSSCNYCNSLITWYDNIPVLSWLFLRGRCRHCKGSISLLYPFIEILTSIIMTALFFYCFDSNGFLFYNLDTVLLFASNFIFFSALIVSLRTDLEKLVIPQIFSIWLVPLGFLFSYLGSSKELSFNILEITFTESLIGAIFGYGILWLVAKLFKLITKKDGLGDGDMELLALIGSFIGPVGVWFTILISSLSGVLIGGSYLYLTKKGPNRMIPFGPFLALGAITFFLFKNYILYYFYSMPF